MKNKCILHLMKHNMKSSDDRHRTNGREREFMLPLDVILVFYFAFLEHSVMLHCLTTLFWWEALGSKTEEIEKGILHLSSIYEIQPSLTKWTLQRVQKLGRGWNILWNEYQFHVGKVQMAYVTIINPCTSLQNVVCIVALKGAWQGMMDPYASLNTGQLLSTPSLVKGNKE